MRLPIILALLVVVTLPKDVQGMMDDVSVQLRGAQAAIGKVLHRDDTVKVAVAGIKSHSDTTKGLVGNLR